MTALRLPASYGGEVENEHVLDAAIIASAQAVEHYEITRYGTLLAWARRTRPAGLRDGTGRTWKKRKLLTRSSLEAEGEINAEAESATAE